MRKENKFKLILKHPFKLHKFPKKIFHFKRPKWNLLKLKNPSETKSICSFTNPLIIKKNTKHWDKISLTFKKILASRRFLNFSYDGLYSSKKLNKKVGEFLEKKELLLNFIVRNEFRLDNLLYNSNVYLSIHQARQEIACGRVLVNDRRVGPNYVLEKGDLICFNFINRVSYRSIAESFLYMQKIYSFIEYDFYNDTFTVIKDYKNLDVEDFYLLITKYIDLNKIIFK
jgi:ribosomal protein S4